MGGGGPSMHPLGAAASLPHKVEGRGCGLWPSQEEQEPTHLGTLGKAGASPKPTLPAACAWVASQDRLRECGQAE